MHEIAYTSSLVDRRESGSLRCSVCGYGIARATPPDRCPMCQAERSWVRPAGGSELGSSSEYWLGRA